MLQLVRIALQRPLTFIVMAVLIVLIGPLAAMRTPTDILPDINIPVIAVVWQYQGLPAQDMAGRIIYYYERTLTSTVNNIEHIESQSLNGVGVVKIFFQPGVNISTASAQVTSISQTVLKQMPPGITPPQVLNYSASTVPILELAFSSKTLGEGQIYDTAQNFIRPALATVPGAATPSPYGGKVRQIQIDLNPTALQAKGLSPADVGAALANQNLIIPAGTAKIGQFEYDVELNDSPQAFAELNDIPIKTVNGATIYMRDVAQVRDGAPPQTNVVRVDGRRSVLMTVLKSGSASTLAIVAGVKSILPRLEQTLPPSFKVLLLDDQSVFVKAAVSGVIREGVIAAALTSLMILLFLGSWRSSLIIAVSIPLAILCSITALSALGQTLNIMTLGGLSLAVGILVDDATVTIENINWHLEQHKPVETAIMDGARQIVTPAFVSLLCICIVFVPMFFLPGVAGFLFVPMAEAVVFAMIASFLLSRTLVPTLAGYLLKSHGGAHERDVMEHHDAEAGQKSTRNPLVAFQHAFEGGFEHIRRGYRDLLSLALDHPRTFIIAFMAVVLASFALIPFLGRNFFPAVDSGQISIHVRAPLGRRIEQTASEFDDIERAIRAVVPPDQVGSIVDNIGLPFSGLNLAYSNTGTIGPQDGDILVSLTEKHGPTADYVKTLRARLPQEFPGTTFAFLPADIISQILNFGAPAPIDLQVSGPDPAKDQAYAAELLARLRAIPGVADARLQQGSTYPALAVDVNRTQADRLGLTEKDVANSLNTSLAGSAQTAPAYWLNPRNGVSYPIVAQTPQYRVDTLSDLNNVPLNGAPGSTPQIMGAVATLHRESVPAIVSHYAIEPAYDLYAATQGRDLGAVATDINSLIKATAKDLPKGATVTLRGQVTTMNSAFAGLLFGLVGAMVLIYLIVVVNFQSWLDPFVIITALPAALAGIVWMLFATATPLSVPALTGAIMCMGVATANSILVVSFCREQLELDGDPVRAALEAGFTRFRPVLMTALAMIIGMGPMALALGEGGEQNAPLGRAVIGGLIFATFATLMFVPVVFSLVHSRSSAVPAPDRAEPTPSGEPTYAH
jgi:multidrug efflux pump subunit AcrB